MLLYIYAKCKQDIYIQRNHTFVDTIFTLNFNFRNIFTLSRTDMAKDTGTSF